MRIEDRIKKLEDRANLSVPGTTLQRVLCDVSILQREGVKVPKQVQDRPRESLLVWGLGIGELMGPKVFFHELTIDAVLRKAEKAHSLQPKRIMFVRSTK